MQLLKKLLKRIPVVGPAIMKLYAKLPGHRFTTSENYWVERYQKGGNSGAGSYNRLAQFKADTLNDFVKEKDISSIIEYGSGDGNQLTLAQYPSYLGFDVSTEALAICRNQFKQDQGKKFKLVSEYNNETADLTLSLDVLYHLVEDGVFESYMNQLFASSTRYTIIYSSNTDEQLRAQPLHVKHRKFTPWVTRHLPQWQLIRHISNKYPLEDDENLGSWADFYIYEKTS